MQFNTAEESKSSQPGRLNIHVAYLVNGHVVISSLIAEFVYRHKFRLCYVVCKQ